MLNATTYNDVSLKYNNHKATSNISIRSSISQQTVFAVAVQVPQTSKSDQSAILMTHIALA